MRVAPCCPTSATRLVSSRHVTTFSYSFPAVEHHRPLASAKLYLLGVIGKLYLYWVLQTASYRYGCRRCVFCCSRDDSSKRQDRGTRPARDPGLVGRSFPGHGELGCPSRLQNPLPFSRRHATTNHHPRRDSSAARHTGAQ